MAGIGLDADVAGPALALAFSVALEFAHVDCFAAAEDEAVDFIAEFG